MSRSWMRVCVGVLIVLGLMGCTPATTSDEVATSDVEATADTPRPAWALALHGGAGVIDRDMPEDQKAGYLAALEAALELGRDRLDAGDSALQVVETVIRQLEDEPRFNAGKGAVFTHDGTHELDASIMDGRDRSCGAVAGVKAIKNPITLARLVMTESRHVFLIGAGAEAFAARHDVETVSQDYFFVERRHRQWQRALEREAAETASLETASGSLDEKYGTVGVVALDRNGDLAAGTSTGGMTNKRFGRVGDVPVIGAGTWADNATAAISCTGFGEQFIRNTVARDVAARMSYQGLDLEAAAQAAIDQLEPGDGGLIAVGSDGSIALVFNSEGMFRGAADADGRFEVAIWGGEEGVSLNSF
ncbi:MAG: isoaspartyl peptidase/L-asparaginase [Acidobacteriota bacterium]